MADETRSSTAPSARGAPRVIAVGGGPGGAGKSLLTVNLGVYLAQLGRSVIIADVDPAGAGFFTMLGLDPQPVAGQSDDDEPKSSPVATSIPGLLLMPSVYDPSGALLRSGKKARWLGKVRELPADYVLLDLGAGISNSALDLFIAADVGVCVTVPEPPAIEATYRFLRALFLRQMRRSLAKERYKLRLVERAMKDLPSLPTPLETIDALGRYDRVIAQHTIPQLTSLRPRLVVSQTRVRSDLDLGPAMRALAGRYLGMDLDYLGYIEHDDSVWLTVRRRRPLLIDSPASKGARNVERIARRVLALATAREGRSEAARLPPPPERLTLYEALGVPRGASDEEIRRASKRQRDIFGEGSLPLTSLVWGQELAREQARVEEAHDTLLDPVRRRAYDLSTFPEAVAELAPPQDPSSHGIASELLMLQSELAREIHAETQFSGALLQKVRESQGIEIVEIAAKTKIAATHLRAIEQDAFEELPALVYTRGFVQELAKCLRLDPSQVARTYLKRMRDALALSGRTAH
ncbi:MAG TPA: helix-turn-helix domain-containing protein [Polyangiaceae bacterium]|nr:helix-turn-helix domain-containing protein [Polyangiaceae bacterium]